MIRHGKKIKESVKDNDKNNQNTENTRQVKLDKEKLKQLEEIYFEKLKSIEYSNGDKLIIKINENYIMFNEDYSLEDLNNNLKLDAKSFEDFLRNFYIYNIDNLINEIYEQKVLLIQEPSYYFSTSESNPYIINFEFLN